MKIAIIGLGYVGITSATGLLELGHQVVGYEKNITKVETLSDGLFPITEPKVTDLLKKNSDSFSVFSALNSEISNF